MMKLFLIVGLGSFLGGGTRFIAQKYLSILIKSAFPYPIFTINILGSLLIGILFGLSSKYNIFSNEVRLFLTTGFCGGFTTFSTFSYDSLMLLKDGNYFYFFIYIFLSVFLGIFFTFVGYSIFK